jgi:hypothetical protein
LTHSGIYTELIDLLETLVPDLQRATRAVPEDQRAEMLRLLAIAYQACSACLAKLAERDTAWIAADRAITAAEQADDPLLMAAGEFRLVLVFLGTREYEQAEHVAGMATDALQPLADSGDRAATSVWGALTLQRAVIAARRNDARAAFAHLAAARQAAERIGADHNDYHTEFGPANVALHEVSVAADLGEAGMALSAAGSVDASGLSAERQGRLWIDVARAHAQRRRVDDAVAALIQAEAITPEQVYRLPLVRQLIGDLLTFQHEPTAELQRLAEAVSAR